MNAGTPTSIAPGVSVRGRMRSAAALDDRRLRGVERPALRAPAAARSTIDSHSDDSTTPASSAARRMASRRLMRGDAGRFGWSA